MVTPPGADEVLNGSVGAEAVQGRREGVPRVELTFHLTALPDDLGERPRRVRDPDPVAYIALFDQ
jgi:hypothetical protein